MKKAITSAELRKVRLPGISEIRVCAWGENETCIGILAKDPATAFEAVRLAAALLGDETCQA
jgi:hypothetical protein